MKIPTNLILLSFNLFSILSNSLHCVLAQNPVLDTDGDEVTVGTQYSLVSPLAGGGTITFAYNPITTCPLNVIQKPFYNLRSDEDPPTIPDALLITFHPDDTAETVVRESTVLNFQFENVTSPCSDLPVWRVNLNDRVEEGNFITSGGYIGNPGCESTYNWFKIELVRSISITNIYKIVYNPQVCFPYKDSNIIVVEQGGQARLLVDFSDDPAKTPLLIQFQKAKATVKHQVQ